MSYPKTFFTALATSILILSGSSDAMAVSLPAAPTPQYFPTPGQIQARSIPDAPSPRYFPSTPPQAAPPPVVPSPLPIPSPLPVPSPSPLPDICELFSFLCRSVDGTYVILGDSLALGSFGFPGYANRYENQIENTQHIELDSRNLGRAGWASPDLAQALTQSTFFRTQVAAADVITWNIGGNDFRIARQLYYAKQCGGSDNQQCLRDALTTFRESWNTIVHEIQDLQKSEKVIIRSMDLYNPFVKEDMAQGTFFIFKPYLDGTNAHIASSLAAANIPYAHVSTAFNGKSGLTDPADLGYIAFDGYHPNTLGHQIIAQLLSSY